MRGDLKKGGTTHGGGVRGQWGWCGFTYVLRPWKSKVRDEGRRTVPLTCLTSTPQVAEPTGGGQVGRTR